MTFIINPAAPDQGGGDDGRNQDFDPMNSDRGPLRHLLIGSPQRLRATIRHLQACRYVEHTQWIPLMPIRPEGLLIRPYHREYYTYLQLPPRRD